MLRPQSVPLVIAGWSLWRENGNANHLVLPPVGARSRTREGVMRSEGGGGGHSIPRWGGKVWSGWVIAACECEVVACDVPVRSVVDWEANGLWDSCVLSVRSDVFG